jgi:hypothetical protein
MGRAPNHVNARDMVARSGFVFGETRSFRSCRLGFKEGAASQVLRNRASARPDKTTAPSNGMPSMGKPDHHGENSVRPATNSDVPSIGSHDPRLGARSDDAV